MNKNSLGCGKMFKTNGITEVKKNPDFICGVADGWGKERLCLICKIKLKEKWDEKDILKKLEGGEK